MARAAFELLQGERLVHVPCDSVEAVSTAATMAALALRCEVGSVLVIAATPTGAQRIGRLLGKAVESGWCGAGRGVICQVENRNTDHDRRTFSIGEVARQPGRMSQHATVMSIEGWSTNAHVGNLAIFEIPEPGMAAAVEPIPGRGAWAIMGGLTPAHIAIVGNPSDRTLRTYRRTTEQRRAIFTPELSTGLPIEVVLAGAPG